MNKTASKLSKVRRNESEKKEHDSTQDGQLCNEFNSNDPTTKSISSLLFKKRNSKYGIFTSLKKQFIPPGEILEEIKQKYDFNSRMKEISKRGSRSSLRVSYTFGQESTSPKCCNQMSSTAMINRTIEDSSTPRQNKGMLLKLNEYKDLNMEMDECKTTNENNPCMILNKTARSGKLIFYDQLKVNEMNSLLSNNKYPTENVYLQNIIKAFITTFPEKFEKIKHYFKFNTSIINSENKQIQMFLVCLDVIISTFDELITDDQKEEGCVKCMTLLDSIFIDFCRHISQNSNYRSEFMKKIWIKRIDLMEVLFAILKSNVAGQSKKVDSLVEDNERLSLLLKKNEEEKEELKNSLIIKNRENNKWMDIMIAKDKKEKEMKDKLEELTRLYEEKSRAYEEISSKFHARLNPFRKNLFGNILSKYEKIADSDSKAKNINGTSPTVEAKKKKDNQLCDTISVNIDNETRPQVNLNFKDIFKLRQSRSIIQNKNLKQRMSLNKEYQSGRKQIQEAIFSIDKEIKQEIINTLANKKQFELYMNKGVNFKGEIVIEMGTQTEIEGSHIDEVVDNDIMKQIKASLQQMNLNFVDMRGMFNSGKNLEEIKEMFSRIQENNIKLNEELFKIIEESDIVYKENENLRTQIQQLNDREDQIKETYSEVYTIFSDTLKDTNSDIVKFVTSNSDKIKTLPEVKEIFTVLSNRIIEAVDKSSRGSIYQNIPKPTLERLAIESEAEESDEKEDGIFRRYKIGAQSEKRLTSSFTIKIVFAEFKENYGKIRVHLSLKQTIKIINVIFFELIEKVYFKTDKVNFDKDAHFIEFGELLIIYFLQHFGLENLAKKKLLEFLQALAQYEISSKRIAIFLQLIQIKKKSEDSYSSTLFPQNYVMRSSKKSSTVISNMNMSASIKTGLQAHGGSILSKPSCINDESNLYFDVFVSRQLLLFIQYVNVNKLLIKSNDENNISLYLNINKLYDILLQVYQKLPFPSDLKKKFSEFLEKAKHPFSKNMKTFYVVDFDELLECISEVIIELKLVYSKILKTIFNSLDSEGKQEITLFEFLILHQYVFPQKFSYVHLESIFNTFCEVRPHGDLLTYEMFETAEIESDFLDIWYFYKYLRVTPGNEMTLILKNLQDELKSSAVTVLDHIMKRLNQIHAHINQFHNSLIVRKVHMLKTKIVMSNLEDQDEGTSIWLSIRIIDDLSLELYNDYKISQVFQELNCAYQELSRATCDAIKKPYIFTYLETQVQEDTAKPNLNPL